MSEQKRIVRNTGILMGMELVIRILEVLVSIILARYLAPQGYGLMAFAVAFVSLFSIIPGFGMGTLVTRDLARDSTMLNQFLSNGLITSIFLSILALLAVAFTGWRVGFSFEKGLIVSLAALLMIFEILLRFTSSFFRAVQQMAVVAFLNMGLHAGWMIATLGVVLFRGNLVQILGCRAAISLLIVAVSLGLVHARLQRLSWNFDWTFTRQMLKRSLPFALFQLFVKIYVKIDVVLLSFMRGDVMTGWYAVAQKFREALSFIPVSVSGAMMPAMSKFARKSNKDLLETLARSCKFLMMIALPVAGGISIVADRLVLLLYGNAYVEAVPALRIVIWTILFSFLNSAFSSTLLAVDREKQVGWALGAGAIFNLLTNFIAIPLWGYVGAAATTVLSEAVVFIIQANLLRKALPAARPLNQMAKLMGATAAMMTFTWFGRGLTLTYTVLGSAGIYLGALVASRALGRDEWTFFTSIFRRKELQGVS